MASYTHESLAHRRKRVRVSGDESSQPSFSDASALASTSVGEQSTDASDYDSDSGSELSESSEEPSSEEEDDDEDGEDSDGADTDMALEEHEGQDGIVNLRANRGKKPTMTMNKEELGPDIREFLKDFLPQLKAANEELEARKKAGTLESLETDVAEDGEPYIEMDLGLGVLEAKDPEADTSSDGGSDSDTEEGGTEKNILDKLMGRGKSEAIKGIEVVQDGNSS